MTFFFSQAHLSLASLLNLDHLWMRQLSKREQKPKRMGVLNPVHQILETNDTELPSRRKDNKKLMIKLYICTRIYNSTSLHFEKKISQKAIGTPSKGRRN